MSFVVIDVVDVHNNCLDKTKPAKAKKKPKT